MGAAFEPQALADYRQATGGDPLMIRVAHDSLSPKALSGPLGLVVAQDNPLRSISLPQVARLFAADAPAATWGDLGLTGDWAARSVRLVGLRPTTPLARELAAHAFPGRDYSARLEGFGHSTEVVARVAHDPDAIGFAALNVAGAEVKVLPVSAAASGAPIAPTAATLRDGRYPLDRQLLIYARRPLDPFVREYLAFALSCEGQDLVGADDLGYLPLTPGQATTERGKLAHR